MASNYKLRAEGVFALASFAASLGEALLEASHKALSLARNRTASAANEARLGPRRVDCLRGVERVAARRVISVLVLAPLS